MLVALLLLLGIVATPVHAQQAFSSPDAAADALAGSDPDACAVLSLPKIRRAPALIQPALIPDYAAIRS
jgi:hypothetical protein